MSYPGSRVVDKIVQTSDLNPLIKRPAQDLSQDTQDNESSAIVEDEA